MELGKEIQELPEDMRFKAMQPVGRPGMGNGQQMKHMKDVLAMSDKDRNAVLDKEIKAELDGMKRFEEMAKNAPPANGAARPNGGRGWGPPTDAQRAQWQNRRLSSTPADTRATSGVYRQLKQARAVQLGTPLPQWGPR